MQKRRNINDNVHGLIRCTPLESRIMGEAIFNRLHSVYQNSVAYLTWPTNRNQRFEHSIGTMKLAGDMFFHSVENASHLLREQFFETFHELIFAILTDLDSGDLSVGDGDAALEKARKSWGMHEGIEPNEETEKFISTENNGYMLPDCSSFLIPSNVDARHAPTCYLIAQAVRLAGMLHDIGHPPFSHAVEASMTRLLQDCKAGNIDGIFADGYVARMGEFEAGGKKLHESFGDLLVKLLFDQVMGKLASAVREQQKRVEHYPLLVEYAVVFEMVKRIFADEGLFSCLHLLVDSMVDADRLDFVQRDSLSAGLGNGDVKYSQIINGMRLMRPPSGEGFCFAFSSKSTVSIEQFLRQRYQGYDTVVFHHRVVKTEALLDEIVQTLGRRALSAGRGADCDGSVGLGASASRDRQLASDISGLWQPFPDPGGRLGKVDVELFGQWNDAWFLTMLTGEYINLSVRAEDSTPTAEEDLLRQQLAEVLYSNRSYISVVKRYEDMVAVTTGFNLRFAEVIGESATKLQECLEGCLGAHRGEQGTSTTVDVGASAKAFLEFFPDRTTYGDDGRSEFENPLVLARRHYAAIEIGGAQDVGHGNFRGFVERLVKDYLSSKTGSLEVAGEPIVRERSLGVGVSGDVYLYGRDGGLVPFVQTSNVKQALSREEEKKPPVYIFVNLRGAPADADSGKMMIGDDMLKSIGAGLFDWYHDNLKLFLRMIGADGAPSQTDSKRSMREGDEDV